MRSHYIDDGTPRNVLRQYAKVGVERLLVLAGVPLLQRIARRRDTLVLAYHNIVPDDILPQGDESLHLPRSRFVEQLDALGRTHDVVPLAAILEHSRSSRPRVAITFDDAYVGALRVGLPELARRGMPATVFVAPGLLGGVTWWDALARPDTRGVPAPLRRQALTEFAGNGDAILTSMELHVTRQELSEFARIANEEDLRLAARRDRIQFGSHTWTHSNLALLTPQDVMRELTTSRDWLAERFPDAFVSWLSYPYGAWREPVARSAAAAGYVGALRVDGGWMTRSAMLTPHVLPRLNVPAGLSLDAFRLRTGC